MDAFLEYDFYQFLFENSMDAILLTKPDGRVFRANQAACRMFQMTESEICLAGRNGLVDHQDPRLKPAIQKRLETGKIRIELTFVRKDQTRFEAECASALFYDKTQSAWSVMIIHDISAFKQIENNLRLAHQDASFLASYDDLTRILNRRSIMEKFAQILRQSQDEAQPMTLILSDIDHFKGINDRFGHQSGDRILVHFVSQLAAHIRPGDHLGRYGGDEFILCIPGTGIKEGMQIAERLRQGIEESAFTEDGQTVRLTASFGVTASCPHDDAPDTMISRVDKLLYQAKKMRNCVVSDLPSKS